VRFLDRAVAGSRKTRQSAECMSDGAGQLLPLAGKRRETSFARGQYTRSTITSTQRSDAEMVEVLLHAELRRFRAPAAG
jgi:hypothetical protein